MAFHLLCSNSGSVAAYITHFCQTHFHRTPRHSLVHWNSPYNLLLSGAVLLDCCIYTIAWLIKTLGCNCNIFHNLSTATHVFVRHDSVRKPLQPPYDGPFPIISRTDKHFTIAINGRNDTISIDRLKPAHIDSEDSQSSQNTPQSQSHSSPSHTPPTPIRNTRSGRHVHFPAYLSHNV